MNDLLSGWAEEIAVRELAVSLPQRWAHSQGVARQASRLAPALGRAADLLAAAAVLHDVGYAPRLAATGFHPLDGARFLRDSHGADEHLTRLVANHSFALLEAEERGLRGDLEREFPVPEDRVLVDALVYCDMTTTPTGELTTPAARLAEILGRYGDDSIVGRFIRLAEPEIHAAAARTEALLAAVVKGLAQPR
ncbi:MULTISPECIES: HD domain-containing protein [unclassified Kitasatospora]|uniref:HD domain-containing protein n=1 Tax=unclassified Kitasatospora TaxID=2633591 RepID=UPI00053B10E5|nr:MULTISPECIES: HD domain-containing protein [unclassified Kitasatospora]